MSLRKVAPEYYRKKAAFCRTLEKDLTRPDIVQALEELAAELEATADHMERKFGKPRVRGGSDKIS